MSLFENKVKIKIRIVNERANICDLLIIVIDISTLSLHESLIEQIHNHLLNLFNDKLSTFNSLTKLIILNKIDLIDENNRIKFSQLNNNVVPLSCMTGFNIQEFLSKLTEIIAETYIFISINFN